MCIIFNSHYIYKIMLKSKTKKSSRRKRRDKTRSRAKGGMHRRFASHTAKTVLGKVFGETWPDRFSKGKDMIDAGLKGAANAAKNGEPRTPSSASNKSFAFDSPRFRISHIESPVAIIPLRVDENYKTPKKPQSHASSEPILLPNRLKHVETDDQRALRLGVSFAPTFQHPNEIVKQLFQDDTI